MRSSVLKLREQRTSGIKCAITYSTMKTYMVQGRFVCLCDITSSTVINSNHWGIIHLTSVDQLYFLTLTVIPPNMTVNILEDQQKYLPESHSPQQDSRVHLPPSLRRLQPNWLSTGHHHSPASWRAEPSGLPKEMDTSWSFTPDCSLFLASSFGSGRGLAWAWKARRIRTEKRTSVFMAERHLEEGWAGAQCVVTEESAYIYRAVIKGADTGPVGREGMHWY